MPGLEIMHSSAGAAYGGGGGAGGSVYVKGSKSCSVKTVSIDGGPRSCGNTGSGTSAGGAGGAGRKDVC